MHRTLLDNTIMEFVAGGYLGLMLGIVLWGLEMIIQRRKMPFPDYAIILAMGGLCVGRDQLLVFFIIAFIVACLISCLGCISERFKQSAWVFGVTISVLIVIPLKNGTFLELIK